MCVCEAELGELYDIGSTRGSSHVFTMSDINYVNLLFYRNKHFLRETRHHHLACLFLINDTTLDTMQLKCMYPGCEEIIEHESEAVAIAYLNNHNTVHTAATSTSSVTQRKTPQIVRPELKQDISAEEWYSFAAEWKTYKRIAKIPESEVADQLYQCCDRPLARLLLKENPNIIEEGEAALKIAMQRMAVLQVAVSVRRTKLLATTQEPGQSFREFFANIRSSASTCEYTIPCPHLCCAGKEPIDYTSKVVKDILMGGVVDTDIRRELMGHSGIDKLSSKEIVQVVEEKEIARNACSVNGSDVGGVSAYRRQSNAPPNNKNNSKDDSEVSNNKKLLLKGKCSKCSSDIQLYTRFRSGKMNKEPFQTCVKCYKAAIKPNESEHAALTSYIESIVSFEERNRRRSETL